MLEAIKNNPVRIGAIVIALLAAIASYGIKVTPELQALLAMLAPLVVLEVVRRFTTGPVTAEKLKAAAK